MSENFFSRWSRRKQGLETLELSSAPPAPSVALPVSEATGHAGPVDVAASKQATSAESEPQQPMPTMADVENLTPSSEFQGFMRQGVPGEVRNAAMKKLFTDPHFNVMDRLDIYIDDYSQPDPLPMAMLRQMASAKTLGLFDDEPESSSPAAAPKDAPVVTHAPPLPTDDAQAELGVPKTDIES